MKPNQQPIDIKSTQRVLSLNASIHEMHRHPDNNAIARTDVSVRLRDLPADLTQGWSHMDPALLAEGYVVKIPSAPIVVLAEQLNICESKVQIVLSDPAIHGFLSGAVIVQMLCAAAQHLDEPGNPFSGDRELFVSVITGCTTSEHVEEIREALRKQFAEG